MFAISLSDLILTIHWMTMSSYYFYYEKDQDDLNNPLITPQKRNGVETAQANLFCDINALFSTAGGALEFLYNTCFCIFLIFLLRNKLGNTQISPKIMHVICIGLTILFLIVASIFNQLGLNLFGTCSLKATSSNPWFGLILLLLYLFISWYTIIYFMRSLDNVQFKEFKKEFQKYYLIYILATSIIWAITAICNLLAELNCQYWLIPDMEIIITIGNISKLFTPIILSVIRYKDPHIKYELRQILSKFHIVDIRNTEVLDSLIIPDSKEQQHDDNKNLQSNQISLQQQFNTDEQSLIQQKAYRAISCNENMIFKDSIACERKYSTKRRNSSNWLINFQTNLRMSKISAIMAGIVIFSKEWLQNNQEMKKQSISDITENDCLEKIDFELTQEKFLQHNPEIEEDMQQVSFYQKIKIQVYAPKVFFIQQQIDQMMVDLISSFDVQINWEKMMKAFASGQDGGKSGEFFYFTSDNKMALKTMNIDEINTYMSKLYNFIQHFQENSESLISKIYGIFTFQFHDELTHIYLIRNVAQCPKEYIQRTFDLKGSKIQREVLKNQIDKEQKDLSKITLKDIDFLNTEKYVKIDQQQAQQCSLQLQKDALFFKNQGLIDYSLLLFKINWQNFINDKNNNQQNNENFAEKDNQYDIQNIYQKFSKSIYILPSNEEQGIYYQMAIIDYLQKWNIEKKVERVSKQIINFNMNIDISAQNQDLYSERFIQEIAKFIFRC